MPTCLLSGPVLRDTARLSQRYPPIARYGVFGAWTWPIGCDTPSPFSGRFPLGEHAKWRCDTPPPPLKRPWGISAILARYHIKTRQIGAIIGRLIFIHLQCWESLPFGRFQRQRCIKVRVLRAQGFYTPLALKTEEGQHLPALEVYKNQSPNNPRLRYYGGVSRTGPLSVVARQGIVFKTRSFLLCALWQQAPQQVWSLKRSSGRSVTFRTRRIGANPEKSDLVNFRGLDWRKFSELCVLLFCPRKSWQITPKIPV